MSDEAARDKSKERLIEITLDEASVVARSSEVEHERAVAIYDLLEDNSFQPVDARSSGAEGPYRLGLSIEENRLIFDIRTEGEAAVTAIHLSLSPFRKIIKDYFAVCESYFEAIKTASPAKIEAIDMGRRGLHNEGSVLLRDRLEGKVEMDHDTARRLFTLLCVLHFKG